MERPRRRGGPRDAADHRRRRRPRRRPRPGGPGRLHHPSTRAHAAGRGGRRAAGVGAGAARPDGPGAHRDHRAAVQRHRVRRRVRQHPAVQRHHQVRLRYHADSVAPQGRSAAMARSRTGRPDTDPAPAGTPAVRVRGRLRSPGGHCRAGLRGDPRRRAIDAPCACRRGTASSA